jgi:Flp pilus assembly protein TadG
MLSKRRRNSPTQIEARQPRRHAAQTRGMAKVDDHKCQPMVHRRRGVLTIELLLILPILLFILLAVFEFSVLLFARSSVVTACNVAARQASLGSMNQEQVEEIVRQVLSPSLQNQLVVYYIPGSRSGEVTTVGIQVPMTNATPDLLWPIGFSLQGRYLTQQSYVVRE